MKNYIVNNIPPFYTETEELQGQINALENNIKFHDVYIKQALKEIGNINTKIEDYAIITHNDIENTNIKYDKLLTWITLPWWKRIFKSKKKFFE